MSNQLKYLSTVALEKLRSEIISNLDRYKGGGFQEFSEEPAWDIGLGVDFDRDLLTTLDDSTPTPIAAVDLANSKIVGKALAALTPSLANEERIWVRLTHLEAFNYSRSRWLQVSDDKLIDAIQTHLFAKRQTVIRDDNAVSRLWWNFQIARTCMPDDPDRALNLILKTADIRSNFVERIWMTSRRNIGASVVRSMEEDAWVTAAEGNFRQFMKTLNKLGGGVVFESLAPAECDAFVKECIEFSKS